MIEKVEKPKTGWKIPPNLANYLETVKNFSWSAVKAELDGLSRSEGRNIAYQAIDRHARGELHSKIALRWLGKKGEVFDYRFEDLSTLSNRFANVLRQLGVKEGKSVFGLTGRIPELYIAALGTFKNKSVFSPLFSAFGPEPIYARLNRGQAAVLVTTPMLYQRKVSQLRDRLPSLKHVLLIGDEKEIGNIPGTLNFRRLMEEANSEFLIPPTSPEDTALLHFTSGTTGTPKGAIHVHGAMLVHYITGKFVLDFHPDDIFWCTADPGWITGTSYGIIAPLLHGVTNIIDEGDFDAERWYRILDEEKISVWYTAPTALRMLTKAGSELPQKFRREKLRLIGSVGEPLNPEAIRWSIEVLGLPIHDNWWQTETGGIMIANYPAMDIKLGSMGKPLPGTEATIVQRMEDGSVQEITQPDQEGELALRTPWPSMFRGYLHEEERYKKCFSGKYYLTGDLAKRDQDGYFWFIGRADDVIKSAGHLIGPFEVESILMEHPAVAEAAVIGKPDPVTMEMVKAFVSLRKGYSPSEELRKELLGFGRKKLGAAVSPKEIDFLESLPKTRSGKIMRRLLKARELGLPEGDLSTLEPNP